MMRSLIFLLLPAAVPPPKPAPPLPILPSVARVKVTSYGQALSVIQEVNLPRGDWKNETLHFHIAFGSPGPRAIDVHLVPVQDGSVEAEDSETGDVIPIERVPRRPGNAHSLLGHDTMAGIAVHLKPDQIQRALAKGNMATLRIRSLVDIAPDPSGASTVVVRLGSSRGTPLALGRIIATHGAPGQPLTKVEAHLCGPDADPHPLAVNTTPKLPHDPNVIAPILSVRHTSDDLCLLLKN